MSTPSAPGSFAHLRGLQAKPQLNGKLVLIRGQDETTGRFIVRLAHAEQNVQGQTITEADIKVKEGNLEVAGFDELRDMKLYGMCEVWAGEAGSNAAIHVAQVENLDRWPDNYAEEVAYLQERRGWGKPVSVGGVTSQGQAKPNFIFYFDADDTASPINHAAMAMLDLLPHFELSKVGDDLPADRQIRGSTILVYSPTMTMPMGSPDAPAVPSAGGDPEKKWSLNELRDVVSFHTTESAAEMYRAHDDPMHRVFGGMMAGGPMPEMTMWTPGNRDA